MVQLGVEMRSFVVLVLSRGFEQFGGRSLSVVRQYVLRPSTYKTAAFPRKDA